MSKIRKQTLPIFILIISGFLHIIWLDRPNSVVFDEVHFGKFINSYCCTGERFFDIHPPHAKLLIVLSAKLGGYDGRFGFNHIGEKYGEAPVFALRLVPALSGILLSLLIYILLCQFSASRSAAFLGALLVTFDNALLVQTRIIAIDGILLAAIAGSLSLYLASQTCRTKRRKHLFLLFSGCAAGLAFGTKFTGLVILAIFGVIALVNILKNRNKETLLNELSGYAIVVVGAFGIYLVGWYLHFALLPLAGPGDAFYKPTGSFFVDAFNLHRVMFTSNYLLEATHHDASKWWSWPIMTTPIYYWNGPKASIYFLGNPVVWWGISAGFLACFVIWICRNLSRKRSLYGLPSTILWIPAAGFLMSYLPYICIPRVLFLYHFLPPLIFMILFTLLFLDKSGWIRKEGLVHQNWFYWGTIVLLAAGFLLILPLTFGWQYPDWYEQLIFETFPNWR